jgi:hypothetical protein
VLFPLTFGFFPPPLTFFERIIIVTHEERIHRRSEIARIEQEIGAKPYPAWEPPADSVMLTSIGNRFTGMKGGVTTEVKKRSAAVLIVDGAYRRSTDEEIVAYNKREVAARCAAADTENLRKRRVVVYIESQAAALPAAAEASEPQLELAPLPAEPKRKR